MICPRPPLQAQQQLVDGLCCLRAVRVAAQAPEGQRRTKTRRRKKGKPYLCVLPYKVVQNEIILWFNNAKTRGYILSDCVHDCKNVNEDRSLAVCWWSTVLPDRNANDSCHARRENVHARDSSSLLGSFDQCKVS